MGVRLPKNTKISDADLHKRLRQTLDSAQRFSGLLASVIPLNLSELPKWTSSVSLVNAIAPLNLAEAQQATLSGSNVIGPPASKDTFWEIRQILVHFANSWGIGHKVFILKDKDASAKWCIVLRHWKKHKEICRSLKGGTWQTITFSRTFAPVPENLVASSLMYNRFDTVHDLGVRVEKDIKHEDPNTPPPNIHQDKAFLVKFQLELEQKSSMLLCDRQRSFGVNWSKSEDRQAFMHGEKAMTGRKKIYRWARRVGDYQLSVCFDRAPEADPLR
ncbi:hypothetical protein H0H81_011684 [Sphagnurus paluster]|uniref:Uncharacterized protein n=1 Tax=Sphagnurus paluster TaxID=117069 RepID=A0A9P7FYB8_9AGAR|nr:hypothetical protein H0H81_011684 [Sphagnurus paluster]